LPLAIQQHAPFAAHRFRDQKAGGPFQLERGGMELEELQVFHRGTGLPGQGDALTTGLGRVGGVGEQMAAATAGQHHRSGANPVQLVAIEHLHAAAALVLHPQLGDPHPAAMHQVRACIHPITQHLHQRAAGAVLHMQHPVMAVGCLEGGGQLRAIAVEGHPQPQQSIHAVRGQGHQLAHGIAIAQSGTGADRVLGVAAGAVVAASDGCDPPLGPAAGGASSGVAVQQQNPQAWR